ncbi:unnamed protein product [Diplocarpon coronariae]
MWEMQRRMQMAAGDRIDGRVYPKYERVSCQAKPGRPPGRTRLVGAGNEAAYGGRNPELSVQSSAPQVGYSHAGEEEEEHLPAPSSERGQHPPPKTLIQIDGDVDADRSRAREGGVDMPLAV